MRLAAGSRFAVAVQIVKSPSPRQTSFQITSPANRRQQPIYLYRTKRSHYSEREEQKSLRKPLSVSFKDLPSATSPSLPCRPIADLAPQVVF